MLQTSHPLTNDHDHTYYGPAAISAHTTSGESDAMDIDHTTVAVGDIVLDSLAVNNMLNSTGSCNICIDSDGVVSYAAEDVGLRDTMPLIDVQNSSDIPFGEVEIVAVDIKTLSRKRKVKRQYWKKNIRKFNYQTGAAHVNSAGKFVDAKAPKPANCSRCRFKCNERVLDVERNVICHEFHSLGDYCRKKDFIASHIVEAIPARHSASTTKQRVTARGCYLSVNGQKTRVCAKFFCSTLGLGFSGVHKFMKARSVADATLGTLSDKRGKHEPKNKTPQWQNKLMRDHIRLYPKIESHYCRKTTKREYLDPKLSIRKMYEQFNGYYAGKIKSMADCNNVPIPKFEIYRRLFCNDFNLSFFTPRKDQCMVCSKYKKGSAQEKESMLAKYEEHLMQKERAQEEKKKDKERMALEKDNFLSCTFDLQSVLH